MDSWTAMGWVILGVLLVGVVLLVAGVLLTWQGRRQLAGSLKYLLDRLGVVEADVRQLDEALALLQAQLRRRGLVDEEDLREVRRELVEQHQREAEQQELVRRLAEPELAARLVKNPSDTLH
ncbi:MAG TPA: hypothetical protein PK668_14600 [Myxococcota bacterium]|nr:hypothetical protein [Myxococcota bacterium]HRY93906.1 hypothetical protein [Myxococcota bacterium]